MRYITLEHHPNDSRLKIIDEDVCQTLSQRMGTGGGNVPLIMEIHEDTDHAERSGGGLAFSGIMKNSQPH